MSRRNAFWLSLFILGLASACTERELTVEPVPLRPRLVIMPPSVSADLPVGSSTDPANSLPLPTYDNAVIAQLRVDGMISTAARSDTYLQAYSGNLDGSGIYVESAFSACYANVAFRFSLQGSMGPGPCLYYPVPNSSWADTSLVQGTGTVSRGPGIPQFTSDCNYQPCHGYSGSQTVSVMPLPATLLLAASASQVDSGQTVLFTASVSPSSMKGLQVPLKILTWRWLPSGGGTGLTTACTNPVNPCSVVIRDAGAMELTALANGAEQVDTAAVLLKNAHVKLTPDQLSMMFSAVLDAPKYIPRHDTSVQMITVSVIGGDGAPIPYRDVSLVPVATENRAGHHHVGSPPKPPGLLTGLVNTGSSGTIKVKYTAPEVSGPVTITGTSTGATPDSTSIDVGLFTLKPYGPGIGYTLIGGDTHGGVHFENHYATQKHIADLQTLAALYYAKFQSGLQYNDSSLPWGGLFDYDWETTPWQKPHGGHRDGVNTDLRIVAQNNLPALTDAQRNEIERIWVRRLKGEIHPEGDQSPHWHLKYPQN